MAYVNPADKGMEYLNQIPGEVKPYYQPYVNAGKQSLGTLQDQYNALLSNPQALMQMLTQGFQESPGYQFNMNQAMNAANNAAAAGGMIGTPWHQQMAGHMASDLAGSEWDNFLREILDLYGTGLQGEQGLSQLGFGAASGLADTLANNRVNQAGMAYSGQQNANENKNAFWRNLATLGGTALGTAAHFIK